VFCNTQVTFDTSANNARSECAISVNPRNSSNIVGASKRFTNPDMYEFSLAAYGSFDGGVSWLEAAAFGLEPGWAGISDPTLAWDKAGNVWLAGLAFAPGLNGALIGIAMYSSGRRGQDLEPAQPHPHKLGRRQALGGERQQSVESALRQCLCHLG
jgi:hypothetical protein